MTASLGTEQHARCARQPESAYCTPTRSRSSRSAGSIARLQWTQPPSTGARIGAKERMVKRTLLTSANTSYPLLEDAMVKR